MKNLFTKGYIETRVQEGEFGEYLKAPMTNSERSAAVGRKMLLCRKKAGLSQSEVCAIIGIAPQTYSGYENGKHEPTLETLVRLAYLYEVSLDVLLDVFPNDGSELISEESKTQIYLTRQEFEEFQKRFEDQ